MPHEPQAGSVYHAQHPTTHRKEDGRVDGSPQDREHADPLTVFKAGGVAKPDREGEYFGLKRHEDDKGEQDGVETEATESQRGVPLFHLAKGFLRRCEGGRQQRRGEGDQVHGERADGKSHLRALTLRGAEDAFVSPCESAE